MGNTRRNIIRSFTILTLITILLSTAVPVSAFTAENSSTINVGEVADEILSIVTAYTEINAEDISALETLQGDIRDLKATYEALSPEDQMMLFRSMSYVLEIDEEIETVYVSVISVGQGGSIVQKEKEGENSWRYLNGEDVSEVLDVIVQEAQSVSEQETDEDIFYGNIEDNEYLDERIATTEGMDVLEYMIGDGVTYQGIDVSAHQGNIDWQQVKNAGIDFAIIRCGYGGDFSSQDDKWWEYNASSCESLGIPYGVYLYSYAENASEIDGEVRHVLRLLQGHAPSLPVYIDIEENIQFALGGAVLSDLATRFCSQISDAGYKSGLYTSRSHWNSYFGTFAAISAYYHWVAEYNSSCNYYGRYETWQYTSSGRVNGIAGNVDCDIWYGEFDGIGPGEVTPSPISISNCTVTLSTTSYTYNGSAKKPAVTVKNGMETLTSGTDYTVSYLNNKNAGNATVTVTGNGSYTGKVSKTFTIKKAAASLAFDEKNVLKSTVDKSFTNELTKKTDGTVTFSSSDANVAVVDNSKGIVTLKGIGTAVITATASEGKNYKGTNATFVLDVTAGNINKASVGGVSLSYGYSGKAYTPALTIKVNGITLSKDTDYTVRYKNNINPGTATITITGIGNYTGIRTKKFEIVDCVSSLVSGKTYQLIPKNNSSTAVCSYSGKMVNNTKVYITDRSGSEAMKFKAVKNSDGTWKLINVKCELSLAVQQNSPEVGAGIVLYDQTSNVAQNWKLSKKSDNSFAIMNAVTGFSVAMSDASALKGTTLSMAETASNGLQRFYIAETSEVDSSFDGTYSVRASKDTDFALNIASGSVEEGANVNLHNYSNTSVKKFKVIYSGAGYYRFVNLNSGLVLSVEGNTKKNGTNVIQSKWAARSGQRWKITENSDGTVTLTNALGTNLHLVGNKTANGTNIVANTPATTKAQNWYLNS